MVARKLAVSMSISIYSIAAATAWLFGNVADADVLVVDDDSGPGVDPEIRDRIFEPGVTTKSGGWGVGLALSRRIVEGVHKGRIELLDGTGGTTFQIRLPVADG